MQISLFLTVLFLFFTASKDSVAHTGDTAAVHHAHSQLSTFLFLVYLENLNVTQHLTIFWV